jgi:LPXTG-motif cell wall-anchored protein
MRFVTLTATVVLLGWACLAGAQQAQVVTVQQTDIKRVAGEVVQVRGNLLTLRHDDGNGRQAYRIPRGATIKIQGEPTRIQDLQPGQKVRIYYRETTEGRVIVLTPPTPDAGPAVMVDEVPAEVVEESVTVEALPETLPETGSPWPLAGLLGVFLVGLGAGMSVLRRRLAKN